MPNTISADLQRQARLDAVIRGFRRRIVPILSFALTANNVALEGTNEVVVPFYNLDTTASTDFVPADGYVAEDSTTGSRKVTINKRKYKSLKVTSAELARQPLLDPAMLLEIKGEKLAEDVVNDIFSVITAANFGDAALETAAAAFDSDDIADLRGVCNVAQWPTAGRALCLNADLDTALFKDDSIKNAAAFGSPDAIQKGIIPNISGFNYFSSPGMPANGERLIGFAAFQSAILVGFSPIKPHPNVMKAMAAYELIPVEVAPGVTIMLEYRAMGDAFMDASLEVVECNYGYDKGNESAIKRIVAPAPVG
jgi:hypothetical protein